LEYHPSFVFSLEPSLVTGPMKEAPLKLILLFRKMELLFRLKLNREKISGQKVSGSFVRNILLKERSEQL